MGQYCAMRGLPGYLVRTDDGANVLIDTGFRAIHADEPGRAAQWQAIRTVPQHYE